MDFRDIGARAGWTALQTFLAVVVPALILAASEPRLDLSPILVTAVSGLLSGIAAGLSVIKTAIAQHLKARRDN